MSDSGHEQPGESLSIGTIPFDLFAQFISSRFSNPDGPICKHNRFEILATDDALPVFTVNGATVNAEIREVKDNNRRIPVYVVTCENCGWLQLFSAQRVFEALVELGHIDAQGKRVSHE